MLLSTQIGELTMSNSEIDFSSLDIKKFQKKFSDQEKRIDWMSILIEKNLDKANYIDYVFICNLYTNDLRYKNRSIIVGESRGLFRLNKDTLEAHLLLPMEGDKNNHCFYGAVTKIINEYRLTNSFPERTHRAVG